MKKRLMFKQTTIISLLTILSISMTGCSNDHDPESEGNHRAEREPQVEEKVVSFSLSLGGDYIEQSEEPLIRAGEEAKTYVGINVTRIDKDDKDEKEENYAYGVFTSKTGITIDLVSGYTYNFEATTITEGTDKIHILNNESLHEPFKLKEEWKANSTPDAHPFKISDIGEFIYADKISEQANRLRLYQLNNGTTAVQITDAAEYDNDTPICSFPRVERYYGIEKGVDPDKVASSDTKTIDINLAFKCFAIEIDATDIPEATSITWKDVTSGHIEEDGTALLFAADTKLERGNNGKWSDLYSLNNLSKTDNEAAISLTFEFIWDRGYGSTETFKTTFEVKPKTKKILKMVINGNAQNQIGGNVNLIEEDVTFTEESENVTYTQGTSK